MAIYVNSRCFLPAWHLIVSPGRQVVFTVYEGSGWEEPCGQAIHISQISTRINEGISGVIPVEISP